MDLLSQQANEIATARAAWSPASGRAFSAAGQVVAALRRACPTMVSSYDAQLQRIEQKEPARFPLYASASEGNAQLTSVCPNIDEVVQASLQVPGEQRAGVIYDKCGLSRFRHIVTEEEFTAAGLNTGAVKLLGLSAALARAGVPQSASDTLTRELVLASGPTRDGLDKVALPVADGGIPVSRAGVASLTLTKSELYAGSHKIASAEELGDASKWEQAQGVLWDYLAEEKEKHDSLRERTGDAAALQVVLAADRDVAASSLRNLSSVVARVELPPPRLLVLTDQVGAPYQTIAWPEALDGATGSVQNAIQAPVGDG